MADSFNLAYAADKAGSATEQERGARGGRRDGGRRAGRPASATRGARPQLPCAGFHHVATNVGRMWSRQGSYNSEKQVSDVSAIRLKFKCVRLLCRLCQILRNGRTIRVPYTFKAKQLIFIRILN